MVSLFHLLAVSVLIFSGFQDQDEGPDFNLEIKPILSNRCFLCHGPDDSSREGGLRLDQRENAIEYAIIPGDAENSDVFMRITESDPDTRMPPASHGAGLTKNEIELIRRWIESGADYDRHWSYVAPESDNKAVQEKGWSKNRIDDFVVAKMEEHGLSPSPPADFFSIIRRLALDLTGLPPTLAELDRFGKTEGASLSEADYESVVDHFLSKPAFGERWAAMWLDHARYADSMGYAEDRDRQIWRYRDYVIRAFNENKPFDQFSIEQLAGDLLDRPSEEQLIATAFHRNTTTNTEGGTIDEEFRSAAVVDRTNTTMAVWMGTTFGCAQCHTHKYDPITQEEYFQIYAFFNSTADNDQPDDAPLLDLYSVEQKKEIAQLNRRIEKIKSEIAEWDSLPMSDQSELLENQRLAWESEIHRRNTNKVIGRYIRLELPKNKSYLSLAEVEVFVGETNVARKGTATQSSIAYNGPPELAIDGNRDGNHNASRSVTHTAQQDNPWWELALDREYELDRIVVWNRTENLHRRLDGVEIKILDSDRNQLWASCIAEATAKPQELSVSYLPETIYSTVKTSDRSEQDQQELEKYFVQHLHPNVFRNAQIARLRRSIQGIKPQTTVPIMSELERPRETYVHIRGSYRERGSQVEPATPRAFHPFKSEEKDRLALARWIVSKDNPLTARVIVNRFWQQLFGIGIVATSEEFGSQGEFPTHPDLLDYLSCQFMDSDWDVKTLLKQMVMSATYRQSSAATRKKMEVDPNNRWLSRGPRFRLSAEMVRDQALACSGLLSSRMYGEPVQPPQPKSGLKFAFRGEGADWESSVGEDRYRRAIYTRWRRSSPYPSMTTFDISNREVCELRRLRTNTPLQALVTLNDPVYVEAAQALARLTYRETDSPTTIAENAFRRCLIRKPSELELQLLVDLYEATKRHFADEIESAKTFSNDPLNPLPPDTNWIEHAAWTAVANTILNLDEMFLKR